MALATRCPNCHALFRVSADQLKLRSGLVRCGACRHVFDATSTLSYVDDTKLSLDSPGVAAGAGAASDPAVDAGPQRATVVAAAERISDPSWALPDERPPTEAEDDGPEDRAHAGEEAIDVQDADAAADGSERAVADGDEDRLAAPAFLAQDDRPRRRGFSIVYALGVVLLGLLLAAQLAATFRAEILVRVPAARPALTELCRWLQCTVNWPARSDLLAVVGSELQQIPGTSAMELTAVVRNRGSFTIALPALEVALTDTQNRTVARKVFAPVDYLAGERDPSAAVAAGLQAGADLTIRIAFEARGLNATGFVVYPFYL